MNETLKLWHLDRRLLLLLLLLVGYDETLVNQVSVCLNIKKEDFSKTFEDVLASLVHFFVLFHYLLLFEWLKCTS